MRRIALFLALATTAWANDPIPQGAPGAVGFIRALDGEHGTTGRAEVDRVIREALVLEQQGKTEVALEELQKVVRATGFKDVKARYFLASAYRLEADRIRAKDPKKADEDDRLYLEHLRAAEDDAPQADVAVKKAARAKLEERARATPTLDQHDSGTYPSGYCGPTALRMLLRREGLNDPGADAVALEGAHPYHHGSGSSLDLLAERARELGLTGATATRSGSLDEVGASVDHGRPVIVDGNGYYSAVRDDGTKHARDYSEGHYLVVTGVDRDASGKITAVYLDNPDGGARETMTPAAFDDFFGGRGSVWMMTYGL
jgi:hypothetical protein